MMDSGCRNTLRFDGTRCGVTTQKIDKARRGLHAIHSIHQKTPNTPSTQPHQACVLCVVACRVLPLEPVTMLKVHRICVPIVSSSNPNVHTVPHDHPGLPHTAIQRARGTQCTCTYICWMAGASNFLPPNSCHTSIRQLLAQLRMTQPSSWRQLRVHTPRFLAPANHRRQQPIPPPTPGTASYASSPSFWRLCLYASSSSLRCGALPPSSGKIKSQYSSVPTCERYGRRCGRRYSRRYIAVQIT